MSTYRFSSMSVAALALVLSLGLGGCGGGKQAEGNALASLDTRLTNAVSDSATQEQKGGAGAGGAKRVGKPVNLSSPQHRATPATQRLAGVAGRPVGGCAGRGLRYGDRWAAAMPQGLGLYPGAHLVEAAGTDTGRCALRVMSFTTADSPDRVVAHYAAQVRGAGFDAERQPCRREIRLGGTRSGDDAAYMLFARRRDGVTEVDIVASAGHPA